MIQQKIGVIGGDLRLGKAAAILAESGIECALFGADPTAPLPDRITRAATIEGAIRGCSAILAPIPLSRDGASLNLPRTVQPSALIDFILSLAPDQTLFAGCIDDAARSLLQSRRVPFVDLCEIPEYAYLNAYATAEAALGLLILNTGMLIRDCSVAIFGGGRIAKYLIAPLQGLGAQIRVFARSPEQRAFFEAQNCAVSDFLLPDAPFADVLINTVPACVPIEPMQVLRPDGLLLELCGVRREENPDCRLLRAPSLPGRYCYRSMGRILADILLSRIGRDDSREKSEKTKE